MASQILDSDRIVQTLSIYRGIIDASAMFFSFFFVFLFFFPQQNARTIATPNFYFPITDRTTTPRWTH